MEDTMRVTLSFSRTNDKYNRIEEYTHGFNHSDEESFEAVLDKVQIMLEAMGYVFDNKTLAVIDREPVTDINPVRPFSIVRNTDDE